MKSKVIGIDLAKNVFQVCALSATNKVLMNKSVRRNRFLATLRDCEPTVVGLESCSSAHHWGRQLEQLGHEVHLIPAQHVKAFATGHKSDRRDALAIAEALQRSGIHCIRPKPIAQQDLQLLSRARERLMAQRTATANQIRGLAREYGVFFSLGYRKLLAELPEALESGDNELSVVARELLDELRTELYALTARIESIQTRLNALTEHCWIFNLAEHQVIAVSPKNAKAWRFTPEALIGEPNSVPIVVGGCIHICHEKDWCTADNFGF